MLFCNDNGVRWIDLTWKLSGIEELFYQQECYYNLQFTLYVPDLMTFKHDDNEHQRIHESKSGDTCVRLVPALQWSNDLCWHNLCHTASWHLYPNSHTYVYVVALYDMVVWVLAMCSARIVQCTYCSARIVHALCTYQMKYTEDDIGKCTYLLKSSVQWNMWINNTAPLNSLWPLISNELTSLTTVLPREKLGNPRPIFRIFPCAHLAK